MKKWDKRLKPTQASNSKSSPLPHDYLKLVEQTLTQALEKGLTEIKKIHPISEFSADGALFGDEVIIAITLSHGPNSVAATTVYASADYNPNAELPGLEATLSSCVESAGSVFDFYLDVENPEKVAQIANQSLGALEEAPFEWTKSTLPEGVQAWVKIDKTNPKLEEAADDWLAKNDPNYKERDKKDDDDSEDFLSDRLDAIKKAKSGSGGDSGPIRH
ncbi:MAG: hypothetical protein JST80_00040 [Bdellovibrionales bacterium]|nr:hypothetical protein [Bdellovibrionales bacterium]